MNSKSVLSRIMTLLAAADTMDTLQGQDKDGNLYSSPSFSLGDDIKAIDADGNEVPVADGEYEIAVKDADGKEAVLAVTAKDGKISEVETTEQSVKEAEEEAGEGETSEEGEEGEVEMSDEKKGALTTDEAHALPNTTDEDPRNRIGPDTDDVKDPIISLSYRIDELEAALKSITDKFASAFPEEGQEVSSLEPSPVAMSKEEDEELPKLDGAPIEQQFSLSAKMQPNNKKKEGDYQSSFLSKLYK